jgi:hypothetical protein
MREDERGDDLAGQAAQVVIVPAPGTSMREHPLPRGITLNSPSRGLAQVLLHRSGQDASKSPHQAGVMEVKTQGVGSAGGAAVPCQLSLENQPMPNLRRSRQAPVSSSAAAGAPGPGMQGWWGRCAALQMRVRVHAAAAMCR